MARACEGEGARRHCVVHEQPTQQNQAQEEGGSHGRGGGRAHTGSEWGGRSWRNFATGKNALFPLPLSF